MKIRKRIFFTICLTATLFVGIATAHAYTILSAGGFSPVPARIVSYNGFSSSINSAISSACTAWTNAGGGTLLPEQAVHTAIHNSL